ncbi:MAG: M48 family metallopeptidase [Planctomycetota bacterium]|nr:M48 family metallopeptidase [Planctomycetota bacterium]
MVALTLAQEPLERSFVPLRAAGAITPAALAGYFLAAIMLRFLATRLGLRAMARSGRRADRWFRGAQLASLAADAWLVLGQALPLAGGFLRWTLEDLNLGHWPLVGKLAVLAPYLAAQVGAWVVQYPQWQTSRLRGVGLARPTWTRGEYIAYSLRHNVLFVLAPLSMVFLVGDGLVLAQNAGWFSETVLLILMPAAWIGVFAFSPALIVRLWRTRSLPPGPLRDQLEAACRRLGLRYRDILLWQTGGVLANAGVMGLAGPLRYILVSDALLECLPTEQVEAVFAHEAAHIVFRHIPYSLLFGLCATTGAVGLSVLAGWALGEDSPLVEVAALAALAGLFFAGFGYISRRFERQADVFGAWAVGSARPGDADERAVTTQGAAIFARALERVGELNGTAPYQYNWRHGSIASRVGYIIWLGSTGGTRRPIDRTVRGIKAALWLACGAGALVAAWMLWPV